MDDEGLAMSRFAYYGIEEDAVSDTETELTLKEFIAHLIYCLENTGLQPLWLCLREDLQEAALKKVDESFERWKQRELEAAASRESMDWLIKPQSGS